MANNLFQDNLLKLLVPLFVGGGPLDTGWPAEDAAKTVLDTICPFLEERDKALIKGALMNGVIEGREEMRQTIREVLDNG